MRARAAILYGMRGREALQVIRLRKLQREVRDIARKLRALELRAEVRAVVSGPDDFEILGGALSPIAARSDEGLAPEGTSGGSDRVQLVPANASQCAKAAPPEVALAPSAVRADLAAKEAKPRVKHGATVKVARVPEKVARVPEKVARVPVPQAERLALPLLSGMERLFAAPEAMCRLENERPADDGKTWCGPCDWRVPTWFGRDCITVGCPLKGVCA